MRRRVGQSGAHCSLPFTTAPLNSRPASPFNDAGVRRCGGTACSSQPSPGDAVPLPLPNIGGGSVETAGVAGVAVHAAVVGSPCVVCMFLRACACACVSGRSCVCACVCACACACACAYVSGGAGRPRGSVILSQVLVEWLGEVKRGEGGGHGVSSGSVSFGCNLWGIEVMAVTSKLSSGYGRSWST